MIKSTDIDIYKLHDDNNPDIYGINWPGCGTKTINETRQFIKLLEQKIIEVEEKNKKALSN